MRQPIYLFLLLLLTTCLLQAQDETLGSWQYHLPYKSGKSLTLVGDEVYMGTANSCILSHNWKEWDIRTWNKLNGYAETEVNDIEYSEENGVLIVAYANSNLDLLKDGRIINMPDIKDKTIVGDKTIYDIHIIGSLAYLGCGFGIVVVNLEKEEIKDTYFIGTDGERIKVSSLSDNGTHLLVATENGVYQADLNEPNLINYNNWHLFSVESGIEEGPVNSVAFFNGHFYATIDSILYQKDQGDNWLPIYNAGQFWNIDHLSASDNYMVSIQNYFEYDEEDKLVERTARVGRWDTNWEVDYFKDIYLTRMEDAIVSNSGQIWIADKWGGLVRIVNDEVQFPITGMGPPNKEARNIEIQGDGFWIAPATISRNWDPGYNNSGVYYFNGMDWEQHKFYQENGQEIKDLMDVVVAPDQSSVYISSYVNGIIEKTGDEYTHYHPDNSSLQTNKLDTNTYRVPQIAFDEEANLWIANFQAQQPISVKTAQGEWKAFSIKAPAVLNDALLTEIAIDSYGHKWFVSRNEGILVYDSGEDILDAIDDQFRLFRNVNYNVGIPSNGVNCVVQDLEDEIWVGTDDGIAVFYCTVDPFNPDCQFSKPIIFPDGSENPVYLLEGSNINSIAIDGADRKWLGTSNGAILLSPDGKETILHFTIDNSPLFSNNIRDVVIDGKSGKVFFATDKGVLSYKGDALEGGLAQTDDVLIYPNPVHADYDGPIAIKGLARDADVKITDISGRLVYQTQALGSQAVWDGRDYNGKKAQTGVYLIMSSNELGEQTFAGKIFLVNE